MKTLIGKKVGMTQIFDEKGKVIPVTLDEITITADSFFFSLVKNSSKLKFSWASFT